MLIPKELVSLAGEYAVASQLARLGHYAQLTLGNRKKIDILVDASNGTLLGVDVKAKQSGERPGVNAPRNGDFLVLVDFQGKIQEELPDFYILNLRDWIAFVESYQRSHPQIELDDAYGVRHLDGWSGINIQAEWVEQHRNTWAKLPAMNATAVATS